MSKTTKTPLPTSKNGNTNATSKRIENTTRTKIQSTSSSTNKKATPVPNITKTSLKPTEEKKLGSKISSTTTLVKQQTSTTKSYSTKTTSTSKPQKIVASKEAQKPKPQPLRPKPTMNASNQPKSRAQTVLKSNVMNTIHNVTVSSPPPVKRELQTFEEPSTVRERTKTRTLQPEEIVILKQNTTNAPSNFDTISNEPDRIFSNESKTVKPEVPMKESVAFEVLFDDDLKSLNTEGVKTENPANNTRLKSAKLVEQIPSSLSKNVPSTSNSNELNAEHIEIPTKPSDLFKDQDVEGESDEPDYEDDFDSYESDFETGSSSSQQLSEGSAETQENTTDQSEPEETSEASEETQLPITVIHKEDERKLDSGSYEMNSRKHFLQQHQQQLDSIETSTTNSEQLDSGISYSAPHSSLHRTVIEPQVSERQTKMSKRGQELMDKIQLDEITVVLFDMKPIPYEYYMKLYGKYNYTQMSTQTNDDRLESNIQTEPITIRSMWTQHPPQLDLKFMRENEANYLNNACGEFESDGDKIEEPTNELARTLTSLNRLRSSKPQSTPKSSQTDFDQLNDLLRRAEFTIVALLNKPTVRRNLHTSNITITQGYYNLNSKFLSATSVAKIFANPKSNIFIVVHDDVEGVYSEDFRNLLSVWNINEPKTPLKLLSTWSKVCRAEICSENTDVIVAGLEDGSVALWDLKEPLSLGVQFGDGTCYFPPAQTITPCLGNDELLFNDVGIVIDIKAFRCRQQLSKLQAYRPVQFASLNDSGILTIWTLVNLEQSNWTSLHTNKIDHSKMEYNSPSARLKLTQSAIYNLRDYLKRRLIRPASSFDKTRSYFESDVFNDIALRELQEVHNKPEPDLNGLRFTGFDVGIERIYVSTNRNFILSCTKTLKVEKFKKIAFESSKGLFATALKLLWDEEYLIVGFSNGSVVAYNCNQQRPVINDAESLLNQSKGSTPFVNPSRDSDVEIGKSCAIQNLVRNERTIFEERPDSSASTRPSTAFNPAWATAVNRLFDKQVLLGGTVLRKDLVNTILVTNDQTKLLALMDGSLRIYDFATGSEVSSSTSENIRDIGLTKESFGRQNLTILTSDEHVQVHIFK